MDASKENKSAGRVKLFVQDPAGRIVGREGTKVGEDHDFLFILNEEKRKEAISKRLIIRYLYTEAV